MKSLHGIKGRRGMMICHAFLLVLLSGGVVARGSVGVKGEIEKEIAVVGDHYRQAVSDSGRMLELRWEGLDKKLQFIQRARLQQVVLSNGLAYCDLAALRTTIDTGSSFYDYVTYGDINAYNNYFPRQRQMSKGGIDLSYDLLRWVISGGKIVVPELTGAMTKCSVENQWSGGMELHIDMSFGSLSEHYPLGPSIGIGSIEAVFRIKTDGTLIAIGQRVGQEQLSMAKTSDAELPQNMVQEYFPVPVKGAAATGVASLGELFAYERVNYPTADMEAFLLGSHINRYRQCLLLFFLGVSVLIPVLIIRKLPRTSG